MSEKHDYYKALIERNNEPEVVEEPVEEVVELQSEISACVTEVEPVEEVEDEPIELLNDVVEDEGEEPVEEPVEEETIEERLDLINGKVSNCRLLKVRTEPNKKANEVAIIPMDTEVKISMEDSNDGWYAVITEYGDVGYCMREFITVI